MKPSQEAEKKLQRLHRRLSFHDEWAFPYDDADNAIRALQKVILKALGRLKGIEAFQEQLRLDRSSPRKNGRMSGNPLKT